MKSSALPIINDTDHIYESWNRVIEKLILIHGEVTYNSWLKALKPDTSETKNGYLVLAIPTRFMKEWICSHYMNEIKVLCSEEGYHTVDIFVSKGEEVCISRQKGNIVSRENTSAHGVSTYLDSRFTFSNFIVASSNALAHAAAKSIAESDTVVAGSNPLFLYGGVGLGKTHLMQAIALHIRENNPERRVVYLSAEKFMFQFINALRNKDITSFKERFRSIDVLMIDDIQFICGKNSTQEEFFHTFNALIDNKKQLIMSGDRSPSDLDGMEERIRSRLGWGLVADINNTTYELRFGILQSKVEQMKADVPEDVIDFLARKINSNVRELEGALNKVVANSQFSGREITLDNTRSLLSDLLRSNERIITIEDIKEKVAECCNVKMSDMNSSRRSRIVARPRQIAMYLSKELTSHSLPEIGKKFGGRDHTTVIHAVKRIKSLMVDDREVRDDVELVTRMLQS